MSSPRRIAVRALTTHIGANELEIHARGSAGESVILEVDRNMLDLVAADIAATQAQVETKDVT